MLVSIVIPVYNGGATIAPLVERLTDVFGCDGIQIILVDDGSVDNSDEVCRALAEKYGDMLKYLKLSRNFGEHNAVIAGLNYVDGDYAVIMDDDFQNPPDEVSSVVNYMTENNFDVVYTYYDEKRHSVFRNLGSRFNDKACNVMLNKPKDLYLSSFKCLNRFIINEIIKYDGPFPYIDGLILRTTCSIGKVKVRHDHSQKNKSGYTFRKLVSLWLNMFINFSILPLRACFFIGSLLALFGASLILFFLFDHYIWRPEGPWPAGWATLLVCVIFFSGAQLISLSLLGEYMGKMYLTANKTPQFVVRAYYGKK